MKGALVVVAFGLYLKQVACAVPPFVLSPGDVTPYHDAKVDSPSINGKVCFEFMDEGYGGNPTEREGSLHLNAPYPLDLTKELEATAMVHFGSNPVPAESCLALAVSVLPLPATSTGWTGTSCEFAVPNTFGARVHVEPHQLTIDWFYNDASGNNILPGFVSGFSTVIPLIVGLYDDADIMIKWDPLSTTMSIILGLLPPFDFVLPPPIIALTQNPLFAMLTAKSLSDEQFYFCDAKLETLSVAPPPPPPPPLGDSVFVLSPSDVTPYDDAKVDSPSINDKVCFEFMDDSFGGHPGEREGALHLNQAYPLDLSKTLKASAMAHLGDGPTPSETCLALGMSALPFMAGTTGWTGANCDLALANAFGVRVYIESNQITLDWFYYDNSFNNILPGMTSGADIVIPLTKTLSGDKNITIEWDPLSTSMSISLGMLPPFNFVPPPSISSALAMAPLFAILTAKTLSDEQLYFCDPKLETLSIMPPPGANGDPHFKTWSGEKYDFHGVCDLVLLHNPDFDNGVGMYIYIRTKQTRAWSFIEAVSVQIGNDTLEVRGGKGAMHYLLNGANDQSQKMNIAGRLVSIQRINDKSSRFTINLSNNWDESIEIKTWNRMVSVAINGGSRKSFGSSLGLMGTYDGGLKMGRDNKTVIDNANEFGQEWQVLSTEPNLFHGVRDVPQHPQKCEMPSIAQLRRRLGESMIIREDAEKACSRVNIDDFDLCVFDVLATNDKDAAGAY